ncbi:hypothetical protein HOY82DRAFT_616017 [Tuber indicum]|nr:hypothetical protein HOY82DRAFT_616017 [Tuber indicum]
MTFGPNHNPVLAIAFRNWMAPGEQGAVELIESLRACENTEYLGAWSAVLGRVPMLNPKALGITGENHNILQGVVDPEVRFGEEKRAVLNEWVGTNAKRYWPPPGIPLAPSWWDRRCYYIDDPQIPALVPLIENVRPEFKIIYRFSRRSLQ